MKHLETAIPKLFKTLGGVEFEMLNESRFVKHPLSLADVYDKEGENVKTHYVLIDLENIQPEHMSVLDEKDSKVIVFVGENQSKISFDLARSVQSLGENAEYIKIKGNGPNALDFHVAFYIGQLSKENRDGHFHIISKDKGFDPLIQHLESRKIWAKRHKDISELSFLKPANAARKGHAQVSKPATSAIEEGRVQKIVKLLSSRGNARPRKLKNLSNAINSLFSKSLGENELNALIDELVKRGIVMVSSDEKNVNYKLRK